MEQITENDLKLVNELSSRKYKNISLSSNTTEDERNKLKTIKRKLKGIADYFSYKYNSTYGSFICNVSPEANPLTRGNTLNHVWSTFFKGSSNKQYAAQISFVIDKQQPFMHVGFYFGGSSAHSLNPIQRIEFETNLANLGTTLADYISQNIEFQNKYNSLFELGFSAYIKGKSVLPSDWCQTIRSESGNTNITAKLFPNEFGLIENTTIDFFVSQVIFLMGTINSPGINIPTRIIDPLTPAQWAKLAERKAEIGLKGEQYILELEKQKLKDLNFIYSEYPKHVALESSIYGFDILSLDKNKNEIFLEVKSTTRKKEDPQSRLFFISSNELKIYYQNKNKYKLIRVYDIENLPSFEELDLEILEKTPDSFIINY